MKKLLSIVMLSTIVSSAFANNFEDKVDLTELADAMIKCSKEAGALNKSYNFTSHVAGKHTRITAGVDQKVITVKTSIPRGFGRTEPGQVLTIATKVTQPPVDSNDLPSRVVVKCTLK